MKKILSILFSGIILLSICIPSFAAETNVHQIDSPVFLSDNMLSDERGEVESSVPSRYVSTETIPANVENYAKEVFSKISTNDLNALDISVAADSLRLSLGIKTELLSAEEYEKYYFPILDGNCIIAVLIIDNVDEEMCYTLAAGKIAEAINGLQFEQEDPARIVVSDTAIYAVSKTSVNMLGESIYATDETHKDDTGQMQITTFAEGDSVSFSIGSANVYDNCVNQNRSRSVVGRSCANFPTVDNKEVEGQGTCWASCIAAIIEYIQNGSASTNTSAAALRDELLTKQTTGGTLDAKKYIKEYTDRDVDVVSEYLPWDYVKDQIRIKDNPCFMSWYLNTTTNHATALYGYDYENTDDSNRRMYFMDPNQGKVITSYGNTYSGYFGIRMVWDYTVLKQ